jgi:hypothetical protein
MRHRLITALSLSVLAGVSGPPPAARAVSVVEWLDAYAAGQHERVLSALAGPVRFDDVLAQLQRDAPRWVAGGGPRDEERRRLVAATVALEAARVGLEQEWKWIQRQPLMCNDGRDECYQPPNVLYWKAPPLLIEWGCELLRAQAPPSAAERWWQLAAVAVAQRAEDPQFLVGDTKIGLGVYAGESGGTQKEIKHLDHVAKRFPNEKRFVLAQGIARDRDWPDDAFTAYQAIEQDQDVGGEALMRLGAMQMRLRGIPEALKTFERAQTLTRDPYVVFLAHYFSAQIYERQPNVRLAESAYRDAVAAVPHAQSATIALASLLARTERRAEAQQLIKEMLAVRPQPLDPWRRFVHADDRFWPLLIGKLRAEIRR